MRKTIIFLSLGLLQLYAMAQRPDTLTDVSIKIRNNSSEYFYYGLAEGDRIEFDLSVEDSASLKGISFSEYEGETIFEEHNPASIRGKKINIRHEGIFYFELWQSGFLAGKRYCSFNVRRYPASEASRKFNTTVYWRTEIDTVWYTEEERYLERIDTLSSSVVMQHVELGKKVKNNRAVIHFNIPDSSDSWGYFIAVDRLGDMLYNGLSEEMEQSNPIVRQHGLMTYIALGGKVTHTSTPNSPQVMYDFTENPEAAEEFLIDYSNMESSLIPSSLAIDNASDSTYKPISLLLLNNSREKIVVFIYITAVDITAVYATRSIRKFRVEERHIPYLKQ